MKKQNDERKEKITRSMELPEGISSSMDGQTLVIRGPKDEVRREIKQRTLSVQANGPKITIESKGGTRRDKKITGSLVAHIKNMVKGSTHSHTYTLKVCSGHFPINVSVANNKLVVKNFLGEKIPRIVELKEDAKVKVEGELIYVTSSSKETAGQVSADIEQLTRRPGYDTRIFQDGIYIINKDGKEMK